MAESNEKKSFWTMKVSVWHILYIILIFFILSICLLCVIPGRINDDAYHNFSFAATITSIVLAVVSIVYSIQSGLSTMGRMSNLTEIESNINKEIARFSTLEAAIKEGVKEIITPIQASVGDIQQRQNDLQKAQDDLAKNFSEMLTTSTSGHTKKGAKDEFPQNNLPQIFAVILLTCLLSQKTGRDIPYHILGRFFGVRSYYCEGVINCLAVFQNTSLQVGEGSKNNRQKIILYDESKFGTDKQLRKLVLRGNNEKLGNDIITALNEYFCEEHNDSVA